MKKIVKFEFSIYVWWSSSLLFEAGCI